MSPLRLSLEARLLIVAATLVVVAAALGIGVAAHVVDPPLALGLALLALLPLTVIAVRVFMRPISRHLRALSDAINGMQDGDFSLGLAVQRDDELGELAGAYNRVGEALRRERLDLHQRELLLDTVMQTSPQAILLLDDRERVIYSNSAARQRFRGGRRLEGLRLAELLDDAPDALRDAIAERQDSLCTVPSDGEPDVLHVSHSQFRLNTREHRLIQLRSLTREVTRQELLTWKKLIRIISHELNNSLAPISSLAHSGRLLVARGEPERLDAVFETIEDRAARLKSFLDGYARFAKLPQPRIAPVALAAFVDRLCSAAPLRAERPADDALAHFDEGQLQQALINLAKNAREAGSPEADIELRIHTAPGELSLAIRDRGPGMSETVLANALLPFYSTKSDGTGLGLTLCREIAEAHHGRMAISNRHGGGLEVRLILPQPDAGTG